jgi:hypothetical protein
MLATEGFDLSGGSISNFGVLFVEVFLELGKSREIY